MNNLKVFTRLIACILFMSIISAVIGAVGLFNMESMNSKAHAMYEKELMGLSFAKEANTNVIDVGRTLRTALLSTTAEDRDKVLGKVEELLKTMHKNVESARPLFWTEKGKKAMADLDRSTAEVDKMFPEAVRMMRNERVPEIRESVKFVLGSFAPKVGVVNAQLHDLSTIKEENASKVAKENHELYQSSRIYMIALVIGGILMGLTVGILISRSITRPLNEAVKVANTVAAGDLTSRIDVSSKDEIGQLMQALKNMNDSLLRIVGQIRSGSDTIATASAQIAAGNQDLSSRTEEQASSLEETASSMEELTSTVKQNADNAKQANQLAVAASEVAVRGGDVVSQVVSTMDGINESSKKMADIITVIDGIAFQTNILALNAAVEAARAGEQGRGFAVVASEVRNLAQRSASAAREIKALIDDSVGKVESGSKLVAEAGTTMDEVVSSIRRVNDIMGEITSASAEQSDGIEQVNQAVVQMDTVTQQNAALVEEAAAAAESLQEQAGHLVQLVSVFHTGNGVDAAVKVAAPVRAASHAVAVKRAVRPALKVVNAKAAAPAASGALVSSQTAGNGDDWEEF